MNKKRIEIVKGKVKHIRQPYDLTVAHFDFTVDQMRILLRIIEALQNDMVKNVQIEMFEKTGEREITLPVGSLLPANSENYSRVKTAFDGLQSSIMIIRGEDSEKGKYFAKTPLVKKYKYFDSNKWVTVEIDKELIPKFLELKKGFTVFGLESVFNMDSANAMRLYLLISQWRDLPFKDYAIDELRAMLKCENKYKTNGDFKIKVLDPAQRNIKENELTELYYTYADIKNGNKITGIRFFIHRKKIGSAAIGDDMESRAFTEVITLLRRHFALSEEDVRTILPEIKTFGDSQSLLTKLQAMYSYLTRTPKGEIRDLAEWSIASIRNHIAEAQAGLAK